METQVDTGGEIAADPWPCLILDDYGLIIHGLAELHCLHGPQDNRLVRASGGSLGFRGGEQLADFPADSKEERHGLQRHHGLLCFSKGNWAYTHCWQWFFLQCLPWETQIFSFINPPNEEETAFSAPESFPCRAEGILVQPCRTSVCCCE